MRLIGRVIFLLLSISMIGYAYFNGKEMIEALSGFKVLEFSQYKEHLYELSILIRCVLFALFGISVFISFIVGRAKFRHFVFAIVLLVINGSALYGAYEAETLNISANMLNIVVGFIIPLFYVLGAILMRLGRR